jgi:hypothetical protein
MERKSGMEKCMVVCPEDKIDAELLLEWREKDGKKVLKGVSCNNPKLMDLKPQDCNWACWEEIEKKNTGS